MVVLCFGYSNFVENGKNSALTRATGAKFVASTYGTFSDEKYPLLVGLIVPS